MRGHRHPPGFDAAVALDYKRGLSYDAICLKRGVTLEAARSLVSRMIREGYVTRRKAEAKPPKPPMSPERARRAEMMRANPNNRPENQVRENGFNGQDITKRPRMSWEAIDALYGWVTVRGRRQPGRNAKIYDSVAIASGPLIRLPRPDPPRSLTGSSMGW